MLRTLVAFLAAPFAKGEEVQTQDLFAAVLVLEAAGEGWEGMAAVAAVVMNRAGERGDVYAVLTERRQFSCLNVLSLSRAIERASASPAWPVAHRLAGEALSEMLPDITCGATHYHSGPRPRWAYRMRFIRRIGNHYFYK